MTKRQRKGAPIDESHPPRVGVGMPLLFGAPSE